jgi:hypothetical protein
LKRTLTNTIQILVFVTQVQPGARREPIFAAQAEVIPPIVNLRVGDDVIRNIRFDVSTRASADDDGSAPDELRPFVPRSD